MITLPAQKTVYFDVDNTLISDEQIDGDTITFEFGERFVTVWKHEYAIKLLRLFKDRNYTVVVWSQSGGDWAQSVVEALGIDDLVDLCITKPQYYVDDLPVEKWMGQWRVPWERKE